MFRLTLVQLLPHMNGLSLGLYQLPKFLIRPGPKPYELLEASLSPKGFVHKALRSYRNGVSHRSLPRGRFNVSRGKLYTS